MRARLVFAGLAICMFALLPGSAAAVLGGQPDTSHPYVALLAEGTTVCSGTLLSPTVMLTAAHCFAARRPVRRSASGRTSDRRRLPASGSSPVPTTSTTSSRVSATASRTRTRTTSRSSSSAPRSTLRSPAAGTARSRRPGIVDTLQNNTPIDLVGYGVLGFTHGGGQPQPVALFQRFLGETTAFKSDGAIGGEFLKLHNGTCFGDSGGPDLLGGTNIVLAENSFVNNNICAGNTYSYRVDTPQAQSWITADRRRQGRQPGPLNQSAEKAGTASRFRPVSCSTTPASVTHDREGSRRMKRSRIALLGS